MSFHNMREFGSDMLDENNLNFEKWLIETCTDQNFSEDERNHRLLEWTEAPYA